MRTVSNTEVSDFLTCTRKHMYRHTMNMEPTQLSVPLSLGILGHKALEVYYKGIQSGYELAACQSEAISVITTEMGNIPPTEFGLLGAYAHLVWLLREYFIQYPTEDFKVLEVESVFTTPIAEGVAYGCRIDILVEMTAGNFRGDLVLVDHKFVNNFKTSAEIDLDGQLPKYIKILRENGYIVTKGLFNQLRYRKMKNPSPSDLFVRTWIKPTSTEIATIWREQEIVAKQIVTDRTPVVRNQNLIVCRNCAFRGPCKADLLGQPTDLMFKANYRTSSYGYVHQVIEDD